MYNTQQKTLKWVKFQILCVFSQEIYEINCIYISMYIIYVINIDKLYTRNLNYFKNRIISRRVFRNFFVSNVLKQEEWERILKHKIRHGWNILTLRKKYYLLHLERIVKHFLNPLTINIDFHYIRIK